MSCNSLQIKTKAETRALLKPVFANPIENDFTEKPPKKKPYRSAFCGGCFLRAITLFFSTLLNGHFLLDPDYKVQKGAALQFEKGLISCMKTCTYMVGEKPIKG